MNNSTRNTYRLLPLALLTLSQGVFAQQVPSAGSQIRQISPTPKPERIVPGIRPESATMPSTDASDSAKIKVKRLLLSGPRVFSESELIALTGFVPDTDLNLNNLRGFAEKITEHYRSAGYFLAQAYLPAQDIQDGVVTISVNEGRFGSVIVRNQSSLNETLVNSQLDGFKSGEVISIVPLESGLMRLSDLPGVNITSTLAPGAATGTSDLIVDIVPGQRVTGSIDADNGGSRYTGEHRLGATLNLNNAAGQGDVASLRVITSGSGLNHARASYQMQFGRTTAGVAYSWLGYELGKEFYSLQAHGTARVASLYASHPLIRSRATNLYALLDLDHKTFDDHVDVTQSRSEKKSQTLTAALRGDHRDASDASSISSYGVSATVGNLNIQTPSLRIQDAATAQSQGHFTKFGFNAMRLQNVSERVSLYAGIRGQVASKNLDVSEKMELGGMNGVRAYPQGEQAADQGYLLTLEARLLLPNFSIQMPGQMQLVGFVDTGSVTFNKNPWSTGDNHRTLSAAGVGFNWSVYNNFTIRTSYARKIGHEKAMSAPDKSGRFWIQAIKYF